MLLDFRSPVALGRIDVTAVPADPGIVLVRGVEPRPIVLTNDLGDCGPGYLPSPITLPHGLTPGEAADLSTSLALAVAHYDVPRARSIANRIDAVVEAETEGRRIPLGMGLTRGWFEAPAPGRSTTRRKP